MSSLPRAAAGGRTLLLVCGDLAPALDLEAVRTLIAGTAPLQVIDGLCDDAGAVATALRTADADRAVVGLCHDHVSTVAILARARRAGAEPFGVQIVPLGPSTPAFAARALKAAAARVAALPSGEPGRAVVSAAPTSRASLLSLGVISIDPIAVLDHSNCAGAIRCGLCVAACPNDAIGAEDGAVGVDGSACDACGQCVPACPTGALRLTSAGPRQIEAQLEELLPVPGVVFRCRKAPALLRRLPAEWTEVELPSLAPVTAGWLLQTLAGGAAAARLAPCSGTCCNKTSSRIDICRTILAQLGDEAAALRVAALDDRIGGPPLLEPLAGATSPRIVLTEPAATADALACLAAGASIPRFDHPASPLGLLAAATTGCTLCGSCAVACPTRALSLDEIGGELVLGHDPRLCTACGLCVNACPEQVLSVRPGIDVARLATAPTELARARRQVCRGCGCELPVVAAARRVRELLAPRWPQLTAGTDEVCADCARRSRPGVRSE